MWKSADLGDEKLGLGLVNELACQVSSFACFLSVFSLNSICFSVCAVLTKSSAGLLDFHLFFTYSPAGQIPCLDRGNLSCCICSLNSHFAFFPRIIHLLSWLTSSSIPQDIPKEIPLWEEMTEVCDFHNGRVKQQPRVWHPDIAMG